MLIKNYYGEGECPECHQPIPDDAKVGEKCQICGNHTFVNTFNKETTGRVIQEYKTLPDGTTICVGQKFVAGDRVTYFSTEYGDSLDKVNTDKEVYCPFNMVQPRPINPIARELRFICPHCGEHVLEIVMRGGDEIEITSMYSDGEFQYASNEYAESDIANFHCRECGFILMDEDDCDCEYEITDEQNVVDWLLARE